MNISYRKAEATDAFALAKVHTLSWQATYKGIINDAYLTALDAEKKALWWESLIKAGSTVQIAENKNILGFSTAGKCRDGDLLYVGQLYAIYLLPEWQRKGIGNILFKKAVEGLTLAGITSMKVWVLRDNPAKQFYRSLGGQYLGEEIIEIGSQKLIEECFGWPDLLRLS